MQKKRSYIGKYISQMYRKGSSFISKELSNIGIGSGQIMYLLELYKQDGKSQEELSEILNIDKGTTARAIKKLEEEGFVFREKDEIDKRAYKIYLTTKSKNLEEEIFSILSKWEYTITHNLDEDEVESIVRLLKKMCSLV